MTDVINGVQIKELRLICDERGRLMEILRNDDKIFRKFGQVYITTCKPNIIKAWHYHKKQDDHFVCVKGKIRLALYDSRKGSSTYKMVNEFELYLEGQQLVRIPRHVYHGFKCISDEEAMVINIPTMAYNAKKPDEYRIDAFENKIPYDWGKL